MQLAPHPEWAVYGVPAQPISQSEWVGYESWFKFNLGALTDRLYWEGRPKVIEWEAIYVGPEILNSPNIEVAWDTTGWDLLVPKKCLLGDINCDDVVNALDLLEWRRFWAQQDARADVNVDGKRNIWDYLVVLRSWLGG